MKKYLLGFLSLGLLILAPSALAFQTFSPATVNDWTKVNGDVENEFIITQYFNGTSDWMYSLFITHTGSSTVHRFRYGQQLITNATYYWKVNTRVYGTRYVLFNVLSTCLYICDGGGGADNYSKNAIFIYDRLQDTYTDLIPGRDFFNGSAVFRYNGPATASYLYTIASDGSLVLQSDQVYTPLAMEYWDENAWFEEFNTWGNFNWFNASPLLPTYVTYSGASLGAWYYNWRDGNFHSLDGDYSDPRIDTEYPGYYPTEIFPSDDSAISMFLFPTSDPTKPLLYKYLTPPLTSTGRAIWNAGASITDYPSQLLGRDLTYSENPSLYFGDLRHDLVCDNGAYNICGYTPSGNACISNTGAVSDPLRLCWNPLNLQLIFWSGLGSYTGGTLTNTGYLAAYSGSTACAWSGALDTISCGLYKLNQIFYPDANSIRNFGTSESVTYSGSLSLTGTEAPSLTSFFSCPSEVKDADIGPFSFLEWGGSFTVPLVNLHFDFYPLRPLACPFKVVSSIFSESSTYIR